MAQKDKKKQTSNSLQDIGKLTSMEKGIQNKPIQETAQNFYSFLHKRNRFYEEVVTLEEQSYNTSKKVLNTLKKITQHDKFEIKKIDISSHTVEKKIKPNNAFKDEIKYKKTTSDFNGWQKTAFYQSFITRHHHNALQLTGGNLSPKVYNNTAKNDLQFKPDWRLAIGLGSGSVFETSISLHHVYGFPYIPASAVKGALRSYLITNLFGEDETENEPLLNAEFRAYQDLSFCKIFGCPDKAEKVLFDENGNAQKKSDGKYKTQKIDVALKNDKNEGQENIGNIIFFDAYPTHSPQGCIKADIMNNHYQPYYNGEAPPADYHKLNPIIFLTVEGLSFQFMVGLRKGTDNTDIELGAKSGDMLSVVSDFLKLALTQHGIGAKTAVGYGYMQK